MYVMQWIVDIIMDNNEITKIQNLYNTSKEICFLR